ncbi:MAG TPA: MBL fold metallo-hydrolase [Alphaproteobacteria bacterium]|jgi:metallo-beta-lactamase family protein|nr:MBL fold metallo-hydrolase [Alphaproteobacteria bacterium]
MKITFLGGVGTVTGSKYLVEVPGRRVLVDCGLFQGLKQLRLRNWEPLPVEPATIDAVVLTHAHLDHSGYLPLFVKSGFKGRVLCTVATRDLCGILLPDAGHLEERDAEAANRHGYSRHQPALPLFTEADARAALPRLSPIEWDKPHDLGGGLTLTLRYAGHILGAAMALLSYRGRTLLFSGDLGRPHDPIMRPPAPIGAVDHLVVESTYGNRSHNGDDPESRLADVIVRTSGRGGTVVIPAFAVGRAQTLLYHLYRLKTARRIPNLPIFLDSPMAIDAGDLFHKHRRDHRLSEAECHAVCGVARQTPSVAESKAIDQNHVPAVIISASGMATGGRVLHHLKAFAPDARNTIVLAGFQAAGTRGAALLAGAPQIKIHGGYVPVRAEVINLTMLSAHADAGEIMDWLRTATAAPRTTFVTHGEPTAADALRHRIEEELHWSARVPDYRDSATIG